MSMTPEQAIPAVGSHRDGRLLRAPLLGAGIEEDIAAAAFAVLVHDQPDLAGLQLGDGPATWTEEKAWWFASRCRKT